MNKLTVEINNATNSMELVTKEKLELVEKCYNIVNRNDIGNNRMSEYQIKNFVLNKNEHITPFGVYKQAKAEIETRFNALIEYHYIYNKDRAERIKYEWLHKWSNRLSKVCGFFKGLTRFYENEINVRKLRAESTKREINHKLNEMDVLNTEVEKLLPRLENATVEELETDYWETKINTRRKEEEAKFRAGFENQLELLRLSKTQNNNGIIGGR